MSGENPRREEPERPFFATAAQGTEGALGDEHNDGTNTQTKHTNNERHNTERVLWRRGSFRADSGEALYEGVNRIDLSDVLDPDKSLRVSATVKHSKLTHSG